MARRTPKTRYDSDNSWRTTIENTHINDGHYKIKVVILDGTGSDPERIYLDKFEDFARIEKRSVIKNISKSEIMFMINQLGRSGKSSDLKNDESLKVFEMAQNYITEHKKVPSEHIALIIKHLILKLKDEDLLIKRRKLELKEGLKRESEIMRNKKEVTENKIHIEMASSTKVKSKNKNVPIEPREVEEGKKYNTVLRVRGEEWRDKVYVDDYPLDGPNLYIAVTNFCDPHLALNLIKIGVPITAVVQIKIKVPVDQLPSDFTTTFQSQTEIRTEQYFNYWKDLECIRIAKSTANDLRNTAFIIFSPPYKSAEQLSADPEIIYDALSHLLYDIQDLTRQHLNYLDNLYLVKITKDNIDNRFMDHYENTILKDIPLECVTIYSILESILQIVSDIETITHIEPLKASFNYDAKKLTKSTPGNKSEKAQTLISEVFDELCNNDKNKMSYRLTYGEEFEDQADPVVINYGNIAKYTTFHLENLDLNDIIKTTLSKMPIYKLWDTQDPPKGELQVKLSYHVNVLLSCFERQDVETAELTRLLHILACRKLYDNRSSLRTPTQLDKQMTISEIKNAYFRRSTFTEPIAKYLPLTINMDTFSPSLNPINHIIKSETESEPSYVSIDGPEHERVTFLFDCPDISELVSAPEILEEHPIDHKIDDFEYFEDFDDINALQILHEYFNKYNCLDYKYCNVTDCLVVMFYNSHDKNGIAREDWRSHIPTAVCLQDFFDFVLEDEYAWIQKEEDKYYDIQNKLPHSEKVVNNIPSKTCIENCDIKTEMLMEGSLKYQEITQLEKNYKTETETGSVISSKKSAQSGRKSAMEKQTPDSRTKSNVSPLSPDKNEKKTFAACNLGDRRVEVFGKNVTHYSKDGTILKSMYYGIIPMNYEWITLNVSTGDLANNIWIHKELGVPTQSDREFQESFRITTKDQITINIKKQDCQIQSTLSPEKQQSCITGSYHSLYITWANGLVVESVHEENSPKISHIKQTYLTSVPHLSEETRCISTNGEVIAFKQSGDIEIFKSDGTCIKMTKYHKIITYKEISEIVSQCSSASPKPKKMKSKVKQTKRSHSRSSMNSSDHKVPLPPLPEYKLLVDEFEMITTDGLKQKFYKDELVDEEKLLIRTATDYFLGEVFSRRMDGTFILLNSDGTQIVTFPDGTKITTKIVIETEEIYPEWTEEELVCFGIDESDIFYDRATIKSNPVSLRSYGENSQYSASMSSRPGTDYDDLKKEPRSDGFISLQVIHITEHINFATVTIDKSSGDITVDSPNSTSVTVSPNNIYSFKLDKVTTAKFDGNMLHIEYEACPQCRSYTTCDIKICNYDDSSVTQNEWLMLKDSFGKKVYIDEHGVISISDEPIQEVFHIDQSTPGEHEEDENYSVVNNESGVIKQLDLKSDVSFHGKCREIYLAKTVKFFVMHRDMSCSELVHHMNVDDYKRTCRWQPWCSINSYDSFGDYRQLVSILSPVHLTETEKWHMNSQMSRKPKNLTYKDLKTDEGKGFYHWMRRYEFQDRSKEPEINVRPRQPRAFILRTLEKQWTDHNRHNLKGGKELITAILKYRQVNESNRITLLEDPIRDPRTEEEKRVYEDVQALGKKVYEDLKQRLADDIRSRIQVSITTKPSMTPKELAHKREEDERQNTSVLKQLESLVEPSPQQKRYWKRREEERKEEEYYKYLLRLPCVPPPYFRNIIGGDIWSKMNDLAGDAVNKAESKKSDIVRDETVEEPHETQEQ